MYPSLIGYLTDKYKKDEDLCIEVLRDACDLYDRQGDVQFVEVEHITRNITMTPKIKNALLTMTEKFMLGSFGKLVFTFSDDDEAFMVKAINWNHRYYVTFPRRYHERNEMNLRWFKLYLKSMAKTHDPLDVVKYDEGVMSSPLYMIEVLKEHARYQRVH
jgi:hypothetical protein